MTQGTAESERRREGATADLVREVVRHLEEDIVFRVLHPRERLVEDDLMKRFGVRRHVVRQALAELELDGLVERKHNIGAQVRALTPKEVVELYALREILETSCARLIPVPVAPAQLSAIDAIQRQHAAAVKNNDVRAVFRANLAFHEAVFRLSGNDALVGAIIDYARQTHPVRLSTLVSADYLHQARDDHEDMLEALRAGNREALVVLCSRHLGPAREAYLATTKHLQ